MPTIMLRGLPADLVGRVRQHGNALGAQGDRSCALALIEYAIAQREARTRGASTTIRGMTPEARSAKARHAAVTRWQRETS